MFEHLLINGMLLAQLEATNCLPQYPTTVSGETICIESNQTDLDCADIGKSIIVIEVEGLESDPHKLDGDKDGVACENYGISDTEPNTKTESK
ncbi:MAG: excalibur calcium-binding domain-containing protein [Okeania sp. SIO2F4]|uniref:excalibur calcium-binding domain-containing protein n=1 Tax=Okeania sp. SIO2F4 TaxID=2607790 RepID=UPI00142948C7|nr:excalibur calcium-binding domain-containing protein [Okeania sp. SIO2F4]NES06307.1 excalibur calcium-binding domain-containing protein [Okeania sp. SIO2F4]